MVLDDVVISLPIEGPERPPRASAWGVGSERMGEVTPEANAEVLRIARALFARLSDAQAASEDSGFKCSPALSIEALIFVAAALIESLPENDNPSRLRWSLEGSVELLRTNARRMRAEFHMTGAQVAETLGAEQIVPQA